MSTARRVGDSVSRALLWVERLPPKVLGAAVIVALVLLVSRNFSGPDGAAVKKETQTKLVGKIAEDKASAKYAKLRSGGLTKFLVLLGVLAGVALASAHYAPDPLVLALPTPRSLVATAPTSTTAPSVSTKSRQPTAATTPVKATTATTAKQATTKTATTVAKNRSATTVSARTSAVTLPATKSTSSARTTTTAG